MNKKKIADIVGKTLMLLSICFVIKKVLEYRKEVEFISIFQNRILLLGLVGLILSEMISICGNAFFYYKFLVLGENNPPSARFVMETYGRSNLYKYIPGNFMHLIGRNQIAMNSSLSFKKVTKATVAEIICVIAGALLSGTPVVYSFVKYYYADSRLKLISLVLCTLLIIALYVLRKPLCQIDHDYYRYFAYMISFSTICNIVMGTMYSVLLLGFFPYDITLTCKIIGAYALSWLIGFITPGAPGGIGVREAILFMLLENITQYSQIIISLIFSRCAFIIGDLIAFILLSKILGKLKWVKE